MPASIGVNMRVTGHYSQGGRLHMEDKFSVAYQQTEDERDLEYAYFGIFDGHGGSEAAAYAKDHLMEAIVRQKHFWSDDDADVLRAIRNGYMMTHMNMWKELEKWPKVIHGLPSTAGTTASVAFIRRGKIYIGHVGDSAIVLGYQVDGKDEWCAKPLTMDHKPESAAEMQRIQSSGGKVVPKSGVSRVVWNRFVVGKGKIRHEEIPFLAIARSLGDHWSYNNTTDEFVVSPDPDVGVLSIDPAKFRCLIFGTDGLWNMISPQTAVSLVQQAQKHNEMATQKQNEMGSLGGESPHCWLNPSKILVDNAIDRWANTKIRADNTSVVTVMMDPPGPPRNRAPVPPALLTPLKCAPQDEPAKSSKTEPSVSAPSRRTSVKSHAEAGTNQDTTPKPAPARISTPNPVIPLPSMSNLQPYSQSCHLNIVEENEEDHVITNYGNPSESYFIARLLNKTQIKNSLQHVYDEIMKPKVESKEQVEEFSNNNNNDVNNLDKSLNKKTTVLQKATKPASPIPEPPSEKSLDDSIVVDEKPEVEKVKDENVTIDESDAALEDSIETEEESIQINEVSSSSPITAPPKPKKRKSKGVVKTGSTASPFPARNLRSNDALQTPTVRPQTRLTTDLKTRSSVATLNVPRKSSESKVPVPVHSSKLSSQTGKTTVVQTKFPIVSPTLTKQLISTAKVESKKVADKSIIKKVTAAEAAKPTEKLDVKNKSLPVKTNESNAIFSRVTRSKDVQSPSADTSKKFQELDKLPTDVQSKACPPRGFVITRHKSSVNKAETFCTPKIVGAAPRGRNREPTLGSNPECFKENMLTPVCPSPRPVPLNSSKRRNSGGGTCELEPREKRRTRQGDKNGHKIVDEQHQDITSTESIKTADFVLSVTDTSFVPNADPENATNDTKLKPKNKKLPTEVSAEVHSTTVHVDSDCSPSKVNANSLSLRALRPRHDTPMSVSDKKVHSKSDQRALRSNNFISDVLSGSSKLLSNKDSRPILRSRNSVGAIPTKGTPRRRVPWPPALRHNLRKRFPK